MTFTPLIPQSGQSLGGSRSQVSGNFANYNAVVSQDHVAPNSTGQGKHNKSTYPVQATTPVTIANECATFSSTINSVPQLMIQPQNQSGAGIQLTRLDTGCLTNLNGYSFIAGGVIYQWGQGSFAANATNTNISFASANINFPNHIFNVQMTLVGGDNACDVTNVANTGFTASRTIKTFADVQLFYWTAIGS